MAILETIFLISLIAASAVNTLTCIYMIMLLFSAVVDWFRNRSSIKAQDKDNIAFTLQEKLSTGKVKTVQGVFNTRTKNIVDGRVIESDRVDDKLASLHRTDALVVYE